MPKEALDHRGWVISPFLPPDHPGYSDRFEMKWGVHSKGGARKVPAEDVTTTISVLISGHFAITDEDDTFELKDPGHYLLSHPGKSHTWRAIADSVVLTVRLVGETLEE